MKTQKHGFVLLQVLQVVRQVLSVATIGIATAGIIGVMFLSACAPTNPRKMAPPESVASESAVTPVNRQMDYNPKVDILFVIDTSESMAKHLEDVKANIDKFVEAFEQYQKLDFQIGVVSVYDSKRYGTVVPAGKFYPLGLLRPLKDPAHPGQPVAGPPFVTRAPGYIKVLGETLKLGIEPRYRTEKNAKGRDIRVDGYGPEYEEIFSPVIAALSGDRNPGFLRADAHLAIVVITDANDDSAISPEELNSFLWKIKGRDLEKYSAYGVIAGSRCKPDQRDPSGPPLKILRFLKGNGGKAFDICSENFGVQLGAVGRLIQQKASRIRIDLKSVPDFSGRVKPLTVRYGGAEIPQDEVKGWTYDPERISIVISGEADLSAGGPDAKVEIDYTPVDLRKIGTDGAKRAGVGD